MTSPNNDFSYENSQWKKGCTPAKIIIFIGFILVRFHSSFFFYCCSDLLLNEIHLQNQPKKCSVFLTVSLNSVCCNGNKNLKKTFHFLVLHNVQLDVTHSKKKKTRTLNKLNANYNVYNFWYCMTNGSVYCLMSYFYDGVKLNDDKKITRSNVFIYM